MDDEYQIEYLNNLYIYRDSVLQMVEEGSYQYVIAYTPELLQQGRGEEAIEMELRRMREELLEQRELDKVINRFESNDLFSNLHYLNKATNLAYYELLGGAENIDTEVEKYKKLTPFDLRRIAEKLFVPENSSTLWYKSVHAKREIITDVSD